MRGVLKAKPGLPWRSRRIRPPVAWVRLAKRWTASRAARSAVEVSPEGATGESTQMARGRRRSPARHLCGLTGSPFRRYLHRRSRHARSRPSFRQTHPRHRRPNPPRPPRQSRLRLQHPPHGLRLRRPRRHLRHRRLVRLFFLVAASSPCHLVLLLCCPHSFSSLSTDVCQLFPLPTPLPPVNCPPITAHCRAIECGLLYHSSAQRSGTDL